MFVLTERVIDTQAWQARLDNPRAGAQVIFEGLVRNHNEGLGVQALEYECFAELAQSEAEVIIAEAKARFKIYALVCVHRTGLLQIGETAVWVGACSAHRQAAFAACQYMIDELKARLPIWKKEHYHDKDPEWVNCQACAHHNHSHNRLDFQASEYYQRQMTLSELQPSGQERLKQARVLVVGAGGLGSPVLMYLAAAGVGQIGICDGDRVEISNLHRQVIYSPADLGRYKADRAAEILQAQNPFVVPISHRESLDAENVVRLISGYDLVLGCSDNFATQFLLHDACYFQKIPLVQASIYQFEGQIQVYTFGPGSACLRCLWPEQPDARCVGNCAEVGVLGVVPGILGAWQASEALKLLLNLPGATSSENLFINLLSNEVLKLQQRKHPACPLCSPEPSILSLEAPRYLALNFSELRNPGWERSAEQVFGSNTQECFICLDIRSLSERQAELSAEPWQAAITHMPAGNIADFEQLNSHHNYLLVCQHGQRSLQLVAELRAKGKEQFYSLTTGMASLKSYASNLHK